MQKDKSKNNANIQNVLMKKNHLNTNKQFMIGNGIMAFAVIFVVVLFIYLALRMQRMQQDGGFSYTESYNIVLEKGFKGQNVILYANDSILFQGAIDQEPLPVHFTRFEESTTLMVVDAQTEQLSVIELSERGGTYRLEKDADNVKEIKP